MITTTKAQNNFGKYLQYMTDHGRVIIKRNGKKVGRNLTDSLRDVLKAQYLDEEVKSARTEKYTRQSEDTGAPRNDVAELRLL